MGSESIISLSLTKDYCHANTINLFHKLIQNPSFKLFAITTDVDNLGIFVAKYGRASGQNFVDLSTNIIASFMSPANNSRLGIDEIVLLPGGEEITIFGIAFSEDSIHNFLSELQQFVNHELSLFNNPQFFCAITFGYRIIDEENILKDIKILMEKLKLSPDTSISSEYYKILYDIRTIISPEVDRVKFNNLEVSSLNELIFLRNVIYSEVFLYKNKTRTILPEIARNLYKLNGHITDYKNYGLGEEGFERILSLKEFLLSKD